MTARDLFRQHLAQTSSAPIAFEVSRAEGSYLYDTNGKAHIDLIGGISVCNMGHANPKVKEAIHQQTEKYLHVMVYGEVIQSPQNQYALALCKHLPPNLQSIYFTNSGSEATEGAMKLAKRVTGRHNMISFLQSYHGSTQGALSVMGSEYWQQAFRPLLPGISQFSYNHYEAIEAIDHQTACVILEPVQAEAGVLIPDQQWLQALRERCTQMGTLLIFDEIQTGFGRTGHLFRFQSSGIIPDILLLGKALGGGLPMGAFISSKAYMDTLMNDPVLGHITTFGGHPLCCAAGLASFEDLLSQKLIETVTTKEALFRKHLQHPRIQAIQSCGLLMALHFESYEQNKKIIETCLANGVFSDWFLFAAHAMRIAPPLTISESEIITACQIISQSIDQVFDAA